MKNPLEPMGRRSLHLPVLLGDKPFQGVHSHFDHSLVIASPSGENESLRQPRIGVRKTLLEHFHVSE